MRYIWKDMPMLVFNNIKTTKLNNGMNVYVVPKEKYVSTFFSMTTNFGGLNNYIIDNDNKEMILLPMGLAHFLEHSIFDPKESRDLGQIYGDLGICIFRLNSALFSEIQSTLFRYFRAGISA